MRQVIRSIIENKSHLGALLLILMLSAFLNTHNINFPVFYHADESKKVHFVLSGQQDFHHPILMLQTARLLNQAFGLTDPGRLILLCRMISASSGVFLVMLTYFLARQGLGKTFALLTALAVAVSPILVIHAHYFKEDLLFTGCGFLSLLFFLKFLRERTRSATILWSLATGLAVSAQYKGLFLILLFLGFPKFLPQSDRRWIYQNFRLGFAVMVLVFLLVNHPLFFNISIFFSGLTDEVGHAIGGHTLKITPFQHWFGFHLVHSLIPGMSLAVTLLALGGLAITVGKWKEALTVDKLLLLYTVVFYLIHEISPMKTFPDYMRYMIPIAPAMVYFAVKAIEQIGKRIREGFTMKELARGLSLTLTAVIIFIPGYDTFRLVSSLNQDTRAKAQEWVDSTKERVWFERYALGGKFTKTLITQVDIEDARKSGITTLIASSFNYDRFFIGAKMSGQDPKVYETHKKYAGLFSYPYTEIKPAYKTFAFSNPVIRIVDIRALKNLEDSQNEFDN